MPPTPDFVLALKDAHAGETGAWARFATLRDRAAREGNAALRLQAVAGLVITGHHLCRFDGFRDGVDTLAQRRDEIAALDRDDALWASNALLLGLLLCQPRDAGIDACADRLLALLDRGLEVNLTLAAAWTLMYHFDAENQRETAMRVHALITGRIDEPGATPYRVAEWLNLWRRCAHYARQPELAELALTQARALTRRHGLRQLELTTMLAELDTALPRGDAQAARAAIERAEALADLGQLRETMQLESARAREARMRGQVDSTLHHATRTRKLAVELQLPPVMLANVLVSEAQALLLAEDFDGARAALRSQIEVLPDAYAGEVATMVQGIDAYLAVTHGHPQAHRQLAELWRGLRERRSYDLFEGFSEFGSRLCVMALERHIETDFVCSLVRKAQFIAPPRAPASWPWPLRIQALGGLAVWRDGIPLAGEGKAQRKPLTLLRAVIALGALSEERGVEVGRIVTLLWADDEAADPKASFDVTLSRLRKWLGVDGALKITDGRLSLNARLVWCDVEAFEHLCDRLQAAIVHADGATLDALLAELRNAYAGKLFGSTTPEPWSVMARERLAMRFARALSDGGAHLEARELWTEAVRLYEAGLVQDLLSEPLHRALIRCQLALGQHAEARVAYERCRVVLRAELGLAPSQETRSLMQGTGELRD